MFVRANRLRTETLAGFRWRQSPLKVSRKVSRYEGIMKLAVVALLCCVHALAQPWAGIIANTRATDWSSVGVEGGIPVRNTQWGATIAAYSGFGCNHQYGSRRLWIQPVCSTWGWYAFTLSSSITITQSEFVALRGMGSNSTKLVFTGASSGCGIYFGAAIQVCTGNTKNSNT